jgi:hypothetical protein
MNRWAKDWDACQGPDCTTPDSPHKGRGLCRNCHWKARYREDPKFMERVKRNAKAHFLRNADEATARIGEWRAENQGKCLAYRATYRTKVKKLTGHSHSYKWKPGTHVRFKALLPGTLAVVCKGSRRLFGEYVIDVRLPSGSVMEEVPTTVFDRLGFSVGDVA